MPEHPLDHEPLIVTPDPVVTTATEKAYERTALAHLIAGVALAILALAAVLYVMWMIVSGPKATEFNADGVRCYQSARSMSCIKTANP
jgi:flagellar basal body-associated protein FliL